MSKKVRKLIGDLIVFAISIFLAYLLIQNGTLDSFIDRVAPVRFLAEFVAGVLFTSFLTTPFSIAIIYVLAESAHPLQIGLIGGLGAAVGDILIVSIFRNSLFDDFDTLTRMLKIRKAVKVIYTTPFRWLAPIVGVFIVASPFPDELGLMLLGASKLKYTQLLILTYTLNAAGIFFVALGLKVI